ncbi:MAG: hypothetical protein FGM61_05270 [Sediminibacterium sp.]|nr:hypothetical protein [Sediminibacterium sp.]
MLQQAQVDEIIAFCEAKGVTYYDVQVELVDHIADCIDNLQKLNSALCFTDALHLAGNQFGDEEFADIVKSKKRLIEKRMSRLIEKEFLSFFTIPRVMITLLLFGISLSIPYMTNISLWTPILLIILVLIISGFHIWPYEKEIRAIKEASRIPLLALTVQSRYERFLQVIQILIGLPNIINLFSEHPDIPKNHAPFTTQKLVTLQILCTTFLMLGLLYISTLYVRRRVYNKIFDQYTKAFISD